MEEQYFEINKNDQEIIYAKMVISLFKSLLKESIINDDEFELLVREINRTFNLNKLLV